MTAADFSPVIIERWRYDRFSFVGGRRLCVTALGRRRRQSKIKEMSTDPWRRRIRRLQIPRFVDFGEKKNAGEPWLNVREVFALSYLLSTFLIRTV